MSKLKIKYTDSKSFENLGFKCGLEIHQQVNTKTKLFCHCPVGLTKARHDAEILRHMRPTLSELGEYDGTALMEFKTKKEVIYRLYRDRTCTYEMDDTPPFLVNQQAIDYAIRLSQLFNCRIIDELHVIRKQYLDGSIPTGFQRTMIIGLDGWIPYKGRKITISQVNLEEESCREVTDIGHRIVFATDRLSTPLVEIITGADMKNPIEAEEVCRLLGNAMKITGLVRRGIGTVRQDVNVSVTGGDRVEIKGVHKVANIGPLTAVEAHRQKGLIELKKIFTERFESAEKIEYRESIVTPLFRQGPFEICRRLDKDQPMKVAALLLPEMVDIISYQLQPGKNFGYELSGRVRVIACIDSKPNLFFYSERENYDIPEDIWTKIADDFGADKKDDIVLICGPSADIETAISEIKLRIADLPRGVIDETRQDIKDNGLTDFERVLPGPDRMYPDTDHPPVKIEPDRVDKLLRLRSEPLWDKQARWAKLGLHIEQIKALSLSPFAPLFDQLSKFEGVNLKKAAHIVTAMFVGLKRSGYDLRKIDSKLLLIILKEALTANWHYSKLKSNLIQLATAGEIRKTAHPEFSDASFKKLFNNLKPEFRDKRQPIPMAKFKRYLAGRMIGQLDDLNQTLSSIDAIIGGK
ncbi:MAG: Glu-tRNA(Gln) amidotransferase subunit GatE [Candidatus Zixiibacteriota bacterium]